MSAIESNWKHTLIAIGVAIAVGIALSTLLTVMIVPTSIPLSPTSLSRTVDRFCDPAASPMYKVTYEQMITCRDLAAQESMAASTASLVRLGWWSLFAGLAGTGFVVWTVLVARRSMELTRDALEHQQMATRLQLRPSFKREELEVLRQADGGAGIKFTFVNKGATPAYNLRQGWTRVIVLKEKAVSKLDPDKLRLRQRMVTVGPGAMGGFTVNLTEGALAQVESGTHVLQIGYISAYEDALNGRYQYNFVAEFWGANLQNQRSLDGLEITEPLLEGRSF